MIDDLAGILGGLGLFFIGLRFLSENLKTLASRRLRMLAARLTGNRYTSFAWGCFAGGITQNMAGLVFILVSMLKAGLISPMSAFPFLLGANIGLTLLVLIVTFETKTLALCMSAAAGALMVSVRTVRFQLLGDCVLGAAMIFLGLALLKESGMSLAEQPWADATLAWATGSLPFAFLGGMILTFVVQSSGVVMVFGITMALAGLLSLDQVIMFMYGACMGSGLIIFVLSLPLSGPARQVAMYQVLFNLELCIVMVPLLYIEIHFDLPLLKALALAFEVGPGQQMALVIIFATALRAILLLPLTGVFVRWCDRLWPARPAEELSRLRYVHDGAIADAESSLRLADFEQRRVLDMFSKYFDAARRGDRLGALRESTREVTSRIGDFVSDLGYRYPGQAVESRNSILTRQQLIIWLEAQFAELSSALTQMPEESNLGAVRSSLIEGIDAVLLVLVLALETGDEEFWEYAEKIVGDRSDVMRELRRRHIGSTAELGGIEGARLAAVTNTVEQVFFLLSKLTREYGRSSRCCHRA